MSNILKLIIITILFLFSFNLKSEEISEYLSPQCIKSIEDSSNIEDFFNIENVTIIENCTGDIFIYNLSNKILYLLYGENVKKSLSMVSTIFNIDKIYFEEFFKNKGSQELLSQVIITVTKVINYIAIILFAIVYIKILFLGQDKILKSGTVDSQFVKNNIKFFIGFSFLFPMEIFGGFSLIQSIVIFIIILATFLGNLVWISSIFLIELNSIAQVPEADINTYLESSEYRLLKDNIVENVYDNISSHICDIDSIEKSLDRVLPLKNESTLFNSDLYKCLNDDNDIDKEYNKIPILNRSHYCLEENNLIKKDRVYCGSAVSVNEELESLRESINFYTSYQDQIREISKNIFHLDCKQNNYSNIEGTTSKFKCLVQDINFNYEYSNEKNSFLSIFKNESLIYSENLVIIQKNIDSLVNSVLQKLSLSLIEKVVDEEETSKMKDIIISSVKSGWLGSNSIYFSNTASPNLSIDGADFIGELFIYNYKSNSIHTDQINSPSTFMDTSTKYKDILNNISLINPSEEYNSGIFDSFNLRKIVIGDEKSKKDCFINSDDSCQRTNLNPFFNLIKNGQEMVFYSGVVIMVSNGVSTALEFIDRNNKLDPNKRNPININIINKFSFLVKLIFFVGIFLSFILPLIPFFVFTSVVIGWIYNTIKTLISIQYLSLLFLIPDENEDFEGMESNFYKILISILIQPFFIVLGLVVSFVLIHFSVALVNGTFSIIMESLNVSKNPSTIMEYIENTVGLIIYLIITTLLVIKSCSAIYQIPKSIQKWFDLNVDNEEGMFQQLRGVAEKLVFFKP
jgi:conjugal transfer/type IV secretion protein DotA/TraY